MNLSECGVKTVNLINDIHDRGINKMAVILRHSARHFDKAENDYLMGLTEQGKQMSYRFGKELPNGVFLRVFSSPLNRCIETASQIEQGYLSKGGQTQANQVLRTLGGFFVKDGKKFIKRVYEKGLSHFAKAWFEGKMPADIIDDAEEASIQVLRSLLGKVQEPLQNHIDVSVSHDLTLLIIKKYCLGLRDEELGRVEYLEGVIISKRADEFYVTNHQKEAKVVNVP